MGFYGGFMGFKPYLSSSRRLGSQPRGHPHQICWFSMTTPPQSKWSNSMFVRVYPDSIPFPGRSFVSFLNQSIRDMLITCIATLAQRPLSRCWSGLIELVFRCRQWWAARKLSWDHHLSGPAKLFPTFPKYECFQTPPAGKGNSVYCWWMGGTIFSWGYVVVFQ